MRRWLTSEFGFRVQGTAALMAAAALMIAGCGGGGSAAVDSSPTGTGGLDGGGAGADGSAGRDGGGGAPADGGDGGGLSLAKRLVPGQAHIMGGPTSACSQATAGADHWCALSLPGTQLGKTDLWVIDVEKALAGDVPCDGTNASCLRLTSALWTSAPAGGGVAHPFAHHFYGQTLIFYTGPASAQPFSGPIMAWRPGWPTARQISSDNASTCDGFAAADVALCVDNEALTADPAHFDVHAGRIGTNALPLAATIYPSTATNASQWLVAFSPAGDYFGYSTGGPAATDVETLYAFKVDEVGMAGKRITVGANISQWDIAPDGKHWYLMRNYNYPPRKSAVDPTGTLAIADFPAGGNETVVAMNVGSYILLGGAGVDRGVAILDHLTAGKGTYKIIGDATKPAGVVTIASGVLSAVPSDDGRFSFLQTDTDDVSGLFNAIVAKNDGSGMCTLAAGKTADSYGAPFLAKAGLVFWTDNITATGGQGWRANPDGCTDKQKFADNVDFWFPVGDRGLIYSDDAPAATATLRYVKLGAQGQWPAAGPTTISTGVGRIYGLLEPERQYVVYEVSGGGDAGGLWAYGPIGFGQP
jgi:hypothetical protein